MTAESFDLAEKLQTPVIVMTDLDLGMNDHISDPLVWDDNRQYQRGKVLTHDQLEAMTTRYGRYLDTDGDGIPYRTIPATHPTKGAFVTRGSSREEYAVYTEDSAAYKRNVDRLTKKFETAREMVPAPEFSNNTNKAKVGVIYFGTSTYAAEEAIELLNESGISLDAMRVKAFPFGRAFEDFVNSHEKIFVVEQNRDAQFKSLMMIELGVNADKLISVLNYDGTPITADHILQQIKLNLPVAMV
jgi:2-oxoglutarate ferredoxin oxidoreductase subunit alpha